jgi:hypothetical protein
VQSKGHSSKRLYAEAVNPLQQVPRRLPEARVNPRPVPALLVITFYSSNLTTSCRLLCQKKVYLIIYDPPKFLLAEARFGHDYHVTRLPESPHPDASVHYLNQMHCYNQQKTFRCYLATRYIEGEVAGHLCVRKACTSQFQSLDTVY